MLNLTHRDGQLQPIPLEQGQHYAVDLRLNALGYALPAGHRLPLALSPSFAAAASVRTGVTADVGEHLS